MEILEQNFFCSSGEYSDVPVALQDSQPAGETALTAAGACFNRWERGPPVRSCRAHQSTQLQQEGA